MAADDKVAIEVACATPEKQLLMAIEVPAGTTVSKAVDLSDILSRFPRLDRKSVKYGIFGTIVKPDHVVVAGDRVEIYRPLVADPKEVRRQLASEGKIYGRGKR